MCLSVKTNSGGQAVQEETVIYSVKRGTEVKKYQKHSLFLIKRHQNLIDNIGQMSLRQVVLPIGRL